jgi:hypothetical protein
VNKVSIPDHHISETLSSNIWKRTTGCIEQALEFAAKTGNVIWNDGVLICRPREIIAESTTADISIRVIEGNDLWLNGSRRSHCCDIGLKCELISESVGTEEYDLHNLQRAASPWSRRFQNGKRQEIVFYHVNHVTR